MAAARAGDTEPDEEATRLRTGSSPLPVKTPVVEQPATKQPVPAPPAIEAKPQEHEAPAAEPPDETNTDFPSTITVAAPVAAAAAADSVAAASPPAPPAPDTAPVQPASSKAGAPVKKKLPVPVLAGVGGVALAAIVAFMAMGSGPAPSETPGVASLAPAASAPAIVASSAASATVVPASAVAPVAASSQPKPAASAPAVAASRPASRPAIAQKPKATPSAAPAEAPRPAVVQASPAAEAPSRPPPAPVATSSTPSAAGAVEACRDKVFLSREFCLAEACEKPGARNHPLCVRWREDKQMREQRN